MRVHLLILCAFLPVLQAAVIEVTGGDQLRKALGALKDGDVLKIAPGIYPPGNMVSGVANLTVEALDAEERPVFEGGNQAWHFVRTPGLRLRNLIVRGQKMNGINIDDGGKMDQPVEDVRIEGVTVEDIGPMGNFDGIKCSGLKGLVIRDCEISGWGGQAIDLVGCRDARITGCTIIGKEGFSQHTGPQFKGGCENVTIEKCKLLNAGERPIQAGGSTGAAYFRPPGANYEARRIFIRDNVIEGGMCATAFTGVTDAEFTGNKVIRPQKWIFRILQETTRDGFKPCGDVKISGNEFIFRRENVQTEINIGPGTAPETFVFENNRWFAEDKPALSKPNLPVEETGGKASQ
jgi:nitrous oxidase accessory protein NosD